MVSWPARRQAQKVNLRGRGRASAGRQLVDDFAFAKGLTPIQS
jgi:hypothetical protein